MAYYGNPRGVVVSNVVSRMDVPTPEKTEMHALDPDEIREVLGALSDTAYHLVAHWEIFCGLSRSEACGLQWRDNDADNATIPIERVMLELKGGGWV